METRIILRRLALRSPLYALIAPSALLVGLFAYYPAASAIYHAFFRWNAAFIEEYIGLQHFRQLLGWAPTLWLFMGAWVLILATVLLGRPTRYRRQAPWVLAIFVVTFAVLARVSDSEFLSLDSSRASDWLFSAALMSVGGMALCGWSRTNTTLWLRGASTTFGFLWFYYQAMAETADTILWHGFGVTFILVLANLLKMVPSIVTAVVIHRLASERWQYVYRVLFVLPMIIPGMVSLLVWKSFFDPTQGLLNRFLMGTGLIDVLIGLDQLVGLDVFQPGMTPSWLGDASLVIPSLIFWGFPWVGAVGVLIYLTGLAAIPESVYEAAALDGTSSFKKFIYIELPLILTQVRINLILMIIGTLQSYGDILILLGDAGGPGGVALVPGLYMFRTAFVELYAGRACAIGIIVFAFILLLTEINNRYVRVEK
ncbi:MAG: sugar ABC transporter permease [Gemmatimonadetes bacterium]|jgi:ABC-type sugar transport system permease subunit|nr:sugar ABC transporter permease [Gemmatimonadota bacterium]MBT7863073.1 sugar ABC transporter permease [Gemmatimonadota bacterium]